LGKASVSKISLRVLHSGCQRGKIPSRLLPTKIYSSYLADLDEDDEDDDEMFDSEEEEIIPRDDEDEENMQEMIEAALEEEEEDDADSDETEEEDQEEESTDTEQAAEEATALGCPDGFALNFMWLEKALAIAVDQVFGPSQRSPLTEYFIWPKTDAWEELQTRLAEHTWIDDRERIMLMNRTTEVINFWQEEETRHTLEEAREKFPECVFMGD